MADVLSWIAGKLGWTILKILARLPINRAKNKVMSETNNRIHIENRGVVQLDNHHPSMLLTVRVNNNSDTDVYLKQLIAWIRIDRRDPTLPEGSINENGIFGTPIEKVSCCGQDHIGWSMNLETNEPFSLNNIRNIRANSERILIAQNRSYVTVRHNIPPYVDFSLYNFLLDGVIEFEIKNIGTFSKIFRTHFDISKEWSNLQTLKDGWKSFLGKQSMMENW